MVARARRWAAVAAAVVLTLTTAACVGGDGRPDREFKPRPTTGLASRLEQPPARSVPGASTWANDYTPSVDMFVDNLYIEAVRPRIKAALLRQGLQEIAHVLWLTDDRIQCDVVVLRFRDDDGAGQRLDFVQSTNNGNGLLKSYELDSLGAPIVYFGDQPNEKGYVQAKAYARIDQYVVEMFVYSPGDVPRTLVNRWITRQVALLEP